MYPLDAIHQILIHKLPPYFQKCRYYGIHAGAVQNKIIDLIEPALKRNSLTIKTFFSILKQILGLEDPSFSKCIFCGSRLLTIDIIKPDSLWPLLNIRHFKINKDPPCPKRNMIKNL